MLKSIMRVQVVLLLLSAVAFSARAAGVVHEETRTFVESPAQQRGIDALRAAPPDSFVAERFVRAADGTLPYRLRSPASTAGSGVACPCPLVVVLHGSDAIGDDNRSQLGAFAKSWAEPAIAARYPAWVVVPQVPTRSADYVTGADGLAAARSGASLPAILALIDDLATRLPIDRSRIYVVGFSMGASAAMAAAVLAPRRFAAVVAIAGIAPDRTLARAVAHVPMLLLHGTRDDENPPASARAWAAALAAAGGQPRFVAIEGMDHRVPPDITTGVEWRQWLFGQRL